MSRKNRKYSEEFKLSVLREYYVSGMIKRQCVNQFGLCGHRILNMWIARYQSEEEFLSLPSNPNDETMGNRSKSDFKEENIQLKKRIRELEKALEFSRLETMARDMMIDKAEEYFDIVIRKKSGAK